jgi:type IV secretory pathway VirB2 component (pilin)
MIIATVQQASLLDPPPESVIASGADWISGLIFGPLANVIAVIAIAWVGLAMLSGRVDIRRGMAVVLGCFLLFGAKGIADGLRSVAMSEAVPMAASAPPPPTFAIPPPSTKVPVGYDPYAGAAVMQPGN